MQIYRSRLSLLLTDSSALQCQSFTKTDNYTDDWAIGEWESFHRHGRHRCCHRPQSPIKRRSLNKCFQCYASWRYTCQFLGRILQQQQAMSSSCNYSSILWSPFYCVEFGRTCRNLRDLVAINRWTFITASFWTMSGWWHQMGSKWSILSFHSGSIMHDAPLESHKHCRPPICLLSKVSYDFVRIQSYRSQLKA